jgi:hypothetical protein
MDERFDPKERAREKAAVSGGGRPSLGHRREELGAAQARMRPLRVPARPHLREQVEAAQVSEFGYLAIRPILARLADLDRDLVLVGGQEVNFWSSVYFNK